MVVGFTGTQRGMSDYQKEVLIDRLLELKPMELHHGDCYGADDEAHEIAMELGIPVIIHPPSDDVKRAYNMPDPENPSQVVTILVPKPYLIRNKAIVDACDLLFVAPRHNKEELRSGTWATYRHALRVGKPIEMLRR